MDVDDLASLVLKCRQAQKRHNVTRDGGELREPSASKPRWIRRCRTCWPRAR